MDHFRLTIIFEFWMSAAASSINPLNGIFTDSPIRSKTETGMIELPR
jgi:hypothetical protein